MAQSSINVSQILTYMDISEAVPSTPCDRFHPSIKSILKVTDYIKGIAEIRFNFYKADYVGLNNYLL